MSSRRILLVSTRTLIKVSQCWPWRWENLMTFLNRCISVSLTVNKTERNDTAFVWNAQFGCPEVQKASNPAFANSWTEYPGETVGLVGVSTDWLCLSLLYLDSCCRIICCGIPPSVPWMWLLRLPQTLLITGFVGPSHKTNPLTANAKTNKNRNERILRNAEDTVRREETEDSHKCQREEGLAKMKIAYKTGTLTTVEAESYYPICKGRNLNCRLTIENKVIGHGKVYISPVTGKFKRMNKGEIYLRFWKLKLKIYSQPFIFNLSICYRNGLKDRSRRFSPGAAW